MVARIIQIPIVLMEIQEIALTVVVRAAQVVEADVEVINYLLLLVLLKLIRD